MINIRLIYNSNCLQCHHYINDIRELCCDYKLNLLEIDIQSDIFESIENIVQMRQNIDPSINDLPILECQNIAYIGIFDFEALNSILLKFASL
jgi:hypothetical protein